MSPISTCAWASTAASTSSRRSDEIDPFAAELIDRFGPLPAETANLLKIIEIKMNAAQAMVAKLDVGAEGRAGHLPQ